MKIQIGWCNCTAVFMEHDDPFPEVNQICNICDSKVDSIITEPKIAIPEPYGDLYTGHKR